MHASARNCKMSHLHYKCSDTSKPENYLNVIDFVHGSVDQLAILKFYAHKSANASCAIVSGTVTIQILDRVFAIHGVTHD